MSLKDKDLGSIEPKELKEKDGPQNDHQVDGFPSEDTQAEDLGRGCFNPYRDLDVTRVNIYAKEADGNYLSKIGDTKSRLIDSIVKALGTMVQEPEYTTDPNQIGSKQFKMYIQKPILEGEDREKVINKLVEIITTV